MLSLFMLVFSFILWGVLCTKISLIAKEKGYSANTHFWWCFFYTPLIGVLLVMALPDKRIVSKK